MSCSGEREREICEVGGVIATLASRRRIGKHMPGVVRQGPDPAAIAVCRDWLEESHTERVILHGSRGCGGWDEQSDLNLIVVMTPPQTATSRAERWEGPGSATTGTPWLNSTT